MTTLYEQYALLDNEIKSLTERKDNLKVEILSGMVKSGEDKIVTEVGSFSITTLKTWSYPEKIVEMGEKFKAAKAKAESTGEAEFVEKPSLRFNGIKL